MLRKVGIAVVALVGAILGLFAAAFAVAQTQPAKNQISDYVADTLSNPQQQAEIQHLGGLLPFDIRVGRFALRDDQGVWLEVNDARVKLSPTSLLKGEVHVEDAGARRVAINHLPPPGPPKPASNEPFSFPELPKLPDSLPAVRVDHLHLDRIELARPVIGQAAVFNLEGSGEAGKQPQASLALRRTDQPTASLDLNAGADLAARTLRIKLDGSETGGLTAALTRQPQAGAFKLSLDGSGPLDDWRGKIVADVERLAHLETTLDLAYASTRHVNVDGIFTVAPGVLPARIAPVVGNKATLALHAGQTAPGVFALEQLRLQAGALNLVGTGTSDANADRLDGRLELQVPTLADLSGLAGVPLAGQARLALTAAGPVTEPALRLNLAGNGITAANVALAQLGGGYDITLLRSQQGAIAGARIDGVATAQGLAVAGKEIGEAGKAALAVQAEIPPVGQMQVQRLALTSGLAELDLSGAVDRATLAGQFKLAGGVPDLAAAMALLPPERVAGLPPVQGGLSLTGAATLGEQANRIDANLALAGRNLAGLPPAAQALLGAAPRLEAKGVIEQKKAINVAALRLEGAALTVTGNPSLGLDRQFGGQVKVELPDLAKLQALAPQPVAGRLTAQTELGGTMEAPAVKLDATGEAIRFGSQSVDRLTLTGRAAGPLPSSAGNLALNASRGGQDLALAADYALENRLLHLSGLELTGPQTRLAGNLDLDLQRTLAAGQLAGGITDLSALSAWTQQPDLAGAVNLEAVLTTPEGRQDASLKAAATGIAGSFGKLDQASLNGAIRDARGKPALDATASLTGFSRPDLAVKQMALTAKGPLDGVDLTLSASGTQTAQPFDLRADARLAALGESKSLLLRSFGGKLAGQAIQLAAPARLLLDQGVLDLDQLDLKVGPAQVQGSLRYGNGQAKGEVRLAGLPLDLLQPFGAPALNGTAQGHLQLAGTAAAPHATLDLTVKGLQPAGAGPSTPATSLRLTANTDGRGLDARLTATGLGDQPLAATATLPLRLSLAPVTFELPRDAPLSAQVQGTVELARAAALAALDGQIVRGRLNADLRLDGTLAQPRLDGRVAMKNGRIDDLTSGASLRDVALTAQAVGRRIELTDLSAADRFGGRIAGKGSLALDQALRPEFNLALSLARARLLDSDLGVAVVSGDLSLDGNGAAAAVRSHLTVNDAELRIPDKVGVSIPQLDVVEKGQEAGIAPESGPRIYPIRLDIGVDAPARLFVRGRGLESEWGGSIKVEGQVQQPTIVGQLRFRRGFLDLLNRRFQIEQGVITFAGDYPPIPQINLEAVATTADVQAVIQLQGLATDPRLKLSSRPELPQDEILSRVLFGRAINRITPIQGIQLAAAVRQLQGGGVLSGVLDSIRKATGFDTLSLQGGETAGEASASAGKYLSDNVYLQLQQGVQPGSSKARVEVQLTPNLSVGTDVSGQAQTGVDLQWRYDY